MADKLIHINQVGYRLGARHCAALPGVDRDFSLIDRGIQPVFEGKSTPGAGMDAASGDDVRWLDFSAFHAAGEYRISCGDLLYSSPVRLSPKPYAALTDGLLKGLYYMRCGTALEAAHAGEWTHDRCHTGDGMLLDDPAVHIDITGGSHDAGDYGKYVAPGAVAVAMMLLAVEHIPGAFRRTVNIPESGNGVPDILNEARWELEWMLKMQRADGGVYHKTTTPGFAGFILPEHDLDQWVVCPVSATATGDFAGVMAMASRIYQQFDQAFAARMLAAAEQAWAWLAANPDAGPFHNPQGVSTGEYGDGDVRDERFWAASSLWRATGDADYAASAQDMLARWPDMDRITFGWGEVGGFAAAELLFAGNAPDELARPLRHAFLQEAERLEALARSDGYAVPMACGDYIWGSTMVLMNRAVHLLLANKLAPNAAWEAVAEDCLHWLCGRNPLGVCYVSGFGAYPVMRQHNRVSEADAVDAPVPGLVAGGPNKGLQDTAARLLLPAATPPARCFADESASYSTNEVAIYWNTPALFVAAWFDAK